VKKFCILLFISALVVGFIVTNIFSFGRSGFPNFDISFGRVRGSGNIVKDLRNTPAFSKLNVSGAFDVDVTAGKDLKVEIEADDNLMPLIETEVSDETLSISTNRGVSPKSSLKVHITAPLIDSVETSGASSVALSDLSGEQLSIDSSGASKVTAAGNVSKLTVELSGASKLNAENLTTESAAIDGSGASKAFVNVNRTLNADLSGASSVIYSGTPANIIKNTSGGASVRQK